MSVTTLRHPIDTYSSQATPTTRRNDSPKLAISNGSGAVKEAWMFFGSMPQPGVYVTEATLSFFTRGTWEASQTITARRVTTSWKAKSLTYRTRPSTTAADAATASTGSGLANKAQFDIDVTAIVRTALLGSGAPFYGFRITTNNTGTENIRSSQDPDPSLRPRLRIEYTKLPIAASDLVPGDGTVVSTWTPVLRWTYYDQDGEDQTAYRVQVDNADDFATPTTDTGWLTSSDPEHDLGA